MAGQAPSHNYESTGLAATVAISERPVSPSPSAAASLGLEGRYEEHTPHAGPRRGSFPSDLPAGFTVPKAVIPHFPDMMNARLNSSGTNTPALTKGDLQPTLSATLAPRSGTVPSQKSSQIIIDEQTDSDPDFKNSIPKNQSASQSVSSVTPTPSPYIAIAQSLYGMLQPTTPNGTVPPPREPKTSSRRVKQYTLPDGTVVSGKGLGRGRPGIKRGPRNPKYKLEDPKITVASEAPSVSAKSAPSSSRKRKRTDSDGSKFSASETPSTRSSSPEYNPTAATRSGRVTSKSLLNPTPSESASPATKRPKPQPTASTPTIPKTHPKIKRRIYRGREELALCEHCLRGHGPTGNVIVFCDACNKCWHQRCHDPQISPTIIADSKAEWFCADCDRILHGKKHKKEKPTTTITTPAQAPEVPSFSGPLIGGATLTLAQKSSYLSSLSRDKLVSLLLSASELAPVLPIFQAPAPVLPAAKFTSTYTTPASATPIYHTAAGAADGDEDEGYETYVDEHALLYPKPGQGIKLPPEREDMHLLLEGEASKTFSHWVRGRDGGRGEFSGSGDVQVNGAANATRGHGNGHGHGRVNGVNGAAASANRSY